MIRLEQILWLILVLIAIACTWQIQFLAGIVSIISLLLVMNLQFTPRSPKFSVHKLLLIKNIDKRIDENVNCQGTDHMTKLTTCIRQDISQKQEFSQSDQSRSHSQYSIPGEGFELERLQKHRGVTVGKKTWSVFDSSNVEKNKSLKGTHNRGMTVGKNTKVSIRTPNH